MVSKYLHAALQCAPSRVGHLFGGRYKAVPVQGHGEGTGDYLKTLMDYIHLNPVRARIIAPRERQSVLDYAWSSIAGGYALPPTRRAKWLAAERGLEACGLPDTTAGRRQMVERLDRRAAGEEIKHCGVPPQEAEVDARCSHLRRGWYWGTQGFGEKMRKLAATLLKKSAPKSRSYRSNPHVTEHGEKQAEAWLKEGLRAAGLKAGELAKLKGSDARKLMLADLLWRRTVVSQEWLAEKLAMKSAANVSQQLRRLDRKQARTRLSERMRSFLEEAESNEA